MRDKNTDICAVGQHAALHGPGKGLIHRQGNEIETKAATHLETNQHFSLNLQK